MTAYYYQIVATNADGDSAASNVATATTFPNYTENALAMYLSLDEISGNGCHGYHRQRPHGHRFKGEAALGNGFINNGVIMHGTGQAASDIVVNDKADLRFTAAQSFTLSAWVLPSALAQQRGNGASAKSRDSGNYYGIYINASNQWVFRGPNGDIVGPTAVEGAMDARCRRAERRGEPTRRFFINGKFVATGAAQAGDGPGNLWIGQQNVNNDRRSLPGTVDEIRVYDRVLGDGEITNLLGPPVLVATSKENQGSAGFQGITIWPRQGRAHRAASGFDLGAVLRWI